MNAMKLLWAGEEVYLDDLVAGGMSPRRQISREELERKFPEWKAANDKFSSHPSSGTETCFVVDTIAMFLIEEFRPELSRVRSYRDCVRLAQRWTQKKIRLPNVRPEVWLDYWRAGRAIAENNPPWKTGNIDALRAWAAAFLLFGIAAELHEGSQESICELCWRHGRPGWRSCDKHQGKNATRATRQRGERFYWDRRSVSSLQISHPVAELNELARQLENALFLGSELSNYARAAANVSSNWRQQLSNILDAAPQVVRVAGRDAVKASTWQAAAELLRISLDKNNYSGRWDVWQMKIPLAEAWSRFEPLEDERKDSKEWKNAAKHRAQLRAVIRQHVPRHGSNAYKAAELLKEAHENNTEITQADIARKLKITRAAVSGMADDHVPFFLRRGVTFPPGR